MYPIRRTYSGSSEVSTAKIISKTPISACSRKGESNHSALAIAVVTLAVDDLDGLDLDWITPPVRRDGALYAKHRTATVRGLAGELLELVETI